MPHRRFQGKIGTIAEKRGRAYVVEILTGDEKRNVIARPEHLQSYEGEEHA
jgi:large subunit ribosomal protein L21e